jgi:hypothetical protein
MMRGFPLREWSWLGWLGGQLAVEAAARAGFDGAQQRDCRLGHDHSARRVLVSAADRYGSREFGINESDGAPDEKEGRPKHQPPSYQACMMRGEMWPRRQETFPRGS